MELIVGIFRREGDGVNWSACAGAPLALIHNKMLAATINGDGHVECDPT